MTHEPEAQFLDGLVDFAQQLQACRSNPAKNYATVFIVSSSGTQTALFKPRQEARDIGIAGDHAFSDFSAWEPRVPCPAEDSKGIVLRSGQVISSEEFVVVSLQLVVRARQREQGLFGETFEGLGLPDLSLQPAHKSQT